MSLRSDGTSDHEFHPVTRQRWPDLVQLFEQDRNPRFCWCQAWRASSSDFKAMKPPDRRERLESLVRAETPVGILGYVRKEPRGWCSIAPRDTYERLKRSRNFAPADERPTWSVMCFFLHKEVRGKGFSSELLQSAVEYARSAGAEVIEGYPFEPSSPGDRPKSYSHLGMISTFQKAGFEEVGRVSPERPIMRRVLVGN